MKKILATTLWAISFTSAMAQDKPATEADVTSAYIKSLETQLVWRLQQLSWAQEKIRQWEEYSKPLYEQPTQTGAK